MRARDETEPWRRRVAHPELEWKLCLGAIPAALCCALLFHAFELGQFLQRSFLTMPVHELGHAVTAWFCGFFAVPTPFWKTSIAEARGWITPLVLLAAIGYLIYRARLANNSALVRLGCLLILLQMIGTLVLAEDTARALVIFGGDAGAMVIGTGLMATFFFGKSTQIYHGWLRWGFLVIGAAAFVDTFSVWWAARTDVGAIPYGVMTGVGLTDPAKLTELHGWSERSMIARFTGLGIGCLIALAAVWAWGVRAARREVAASH